MPQEYIVVDASIKYMNARNPLEEGLFYCNESHWSRKLDLAIKYSDANSAIQIAKKITEEEKLPKKVLIIERNGNNIGVGEIKF